MPGEAGKRVSAMHEAVEEIETALRSLGRPSPWSPDCKASDDFLQPLFRTWFAKLGLPDLMAEKSFHELVEHVPRPEIDPEIREKLDVIARVAAEAAAPDGGMDTS